MREQHLRRNDLFRQEPSCGCQTWIRRVGCSQNLTSIDAQREYRYAIDEFVEWFGPIKDGLPTIPGHSAALRMQGHILSLLETGRVS